MPPLVDIRNPTGNTILNQLDELAFKNWHDFWQGTTSRQGLNPDPDAPGHLYDYRGQYKAGVPMLPDPTDNYMLHGDSRFKKPGHSRSIVEEGDQFLNTKTGQRGSFSELVPARPIGYSPIGFGNAPRGVDPMGATGAVSNTYQPTPQARALGRVIEALQDPRNAWMGTGLAGGTIRGLGGLRGKLFQPHVPDSGGFNVPASKMRQDMGWVRPNIPKMEVPSTDQGFRSDYMGEMRVRDELAKKLFTQQAAEQAGHDVLGAFEITDPRLKKSVEDVIIGQSDLYHQTRLRPWTTPGQEGPPPDYILRRYGFGKN